MNLYVPRDKPHPHSHSHTLSHSLTHSPNRTTHLSSLFILFAMVFYCSKYSSLSHSIPIMIITITMFLSCQWWPCRSLRVARRCSSPSLLSFFLSFFLFSAHGLFYSTFDPSTGIPFPAFPPFTTICMYTCIHEHVHTYIHIHTYIHTYLYIYIYIYIYIHIYKYIYIYTYVYTYIHAYTNIHMQICTCIRILYSRCIVRPIITLFPLLVDRILSTSLVFFLTHGQVGGPNAGVCVCVCVSLSVSLSLSCVLLLLLLLLFDLTRWSNLAASCLFPPSSIHILKWKRIH